jgi:hypothetical protein
VTTEAGRVRGAADITARSESGSFEDTATHPRRLLKIGGVNARPHIWKRFLNGCGLMATPLPDRHKCRNLAEFSGFVLNAPLS